jgi:hypothetical protein
MISIFFVHTMAFYVLKAFNFLLTELFCANPQLKSSEMYTNTLALWQNFNSVAQKNVKEFYVHVTVHRNKFLYNKTNQMS